jgi:hypothetical protein
LAKNPDFDVAAAHKYFAAHCFNSAWDLLDKATRSAEDERLMVALNQASIYHWLCRQDCEPKRLSIGYWQASRIQAVLGNAGEARRYAEVCLSYSVALDPFFLGYAHEALARAAYVAAETIVAEEHVSLATAQAALVGRKEDRALLLKDLEILKQHHSRTAA